MIYEIEDHVFPVWITMCREAVMGDVRRLGNLREDILDIWVKMIHRENDEQYVDYVVVKIWCINYTYHWRMSTFAWHTLLDYILHPDLEKPELNTLKWQKEGF